MKNDLYLINNVVKQFMCSVAIVKLNWQNLFDDFSVAKQEILLNKTVNSVLVLKYPLPINYQKSFVKFVINKLERQGTVVSDGWYEAYGRLVALPSGHSTIFKHYMFGKCDLLPIKVITLKENSNLISYGTTGLRTWQASLGLSEWLLENKSIYENKIVLELGSGIGLTGLVLSLFCLPKQVYLTDCHSTVLNTLCENIEININSAELTVQRQLLNNCVFRKVIADSSCEINVLNLPWQEVDEDFCKQIGEIDIIIASDLVYDVDLIKYLISAIRCFFKYSCVKQILFSCTERNKQTLNEFLSCVEKELFTIKELEVPSQKHFIWSTETPVRLFSVVENVIEKDD